MIKEKKTSSLELTGVVKVRYINTPEHFNKLAYDASSLFENSSNIGPTVAKILLGEFKEGQDTIPKEFTDKTAKFIRRALLSTSMDFLPAKATFKINDEYKIIHDVLGEIIVKDGIVTKIKSAQFIE